MKRAPVDRNTLSGYTVEEMLAAVFYLSTTDVQMQFIILLENLTIPLCA